MKQYLQKCIVDEVNQTIGPYFGFQCDEVTDSSNWEQLGIYECEKITGAAMCDKIVKSLMDACLDVQLCRSQTMDGSEAIGQTETGWDTKATTDAYGLLKRITDSGFIMCFHTVLHMFGYESGLSSKLQGSTLGIIERIKWSILAKELYLLPEIPILKSYFKSRLKTHRK
ncbi:hypothetical protein MAR_020527 [Mya arenaria]|uniref:Uncharacterized protein n=1 Tax=Mya arenaria TaxID=6604 RepID=A0ABY7E576_MYAAR|nr:hypothetical protein MAR_020527 [Mya arenaria]